MVQSFAEGLALLQGANERSLPADSRFELDCGAISELWRRGSVITSWLLDLVADALAEDPACEGFSAEVGESGEGRWALEAALERRVSTPALAASLFTRFRSRQTDAFPDRLLSAMRAKFGGHQAPAKTG
jgi:6-phosphogluconate dehydrogenase